MTALPPVTLCLINHNGAAHLPATLAAAAAQPWPFAELVLIDNASIDGSRELAVASWPACRIVRLDRNHGPGAARNAGLGQAAHDLVLFLDNDVRLGDGTVARLVDALQAHPSALLVAPRVVYEAAPGTIQYESADCHFLGLMMPRHADRPVAATPSLPAATGSLITACFLIDRRRWSGGPLFDETLGFNLEDHDFGLRARLRGHELRVEPAALVRHGQGTPGLSYRPGGTPSGERVFYLVRNRWIVVAKTFRVRTLVLLAPAFLLFELAQLAMLLAAGQGRTWWRALRSLAERWPAVRQWRREVQASRRITDRAVLTAGPLPFTAWAKGGWPRRIAIGLLAGGLEIHWRLVRRLI